MNSPGRIGIGLAILALLVGLPGLGEIGVTWDEPRYFLSVERIRDWASTATSSDWRAALDADAIRAAWDAERYYNPHPPAYKIGMAVTGAAFEDLLGLPAAYRLSTLLQFAVLVGLVAWFTGRLTRPAAGLAAGLSLILMPRMLGHAHIGATDVPLSLLWFGATMAALFYWREGRRRWIVLGGLCMGLGFATKFTAFLVVVPLVAWMVLVARSRRSITYLVYGLALAMLVAVLVNPAAWPDPIGYQRRLILESLGREESIPISVFYAGSIYTFFAPWHHMIVMSLATLPVGITALSTIALKTAVRRGPTRPLAWLCVVQFYFWWLLMALPTSPDHDGVRLWLPMFPFAAVMAGIGFGILAGAAKRRFPADRGNLVLAGLGFLFFGPAAVGTAGAAPYYLSYYGELIGGPAGAARQGMEATYWFDAVTAGFRERLEETLPPDAVVVAYPNAEYYVLLQNMGLLRDDLEFVRTPPADYLVLLARKAMLTNGWRAVYREAQPMLAAELDGVELVGLYRFEAPPEGPASPAEGEAP